VHIWDARTGRDLLTIKNLAEISWGLSFSADGRRLAVGDRNCVRIFDTTQGVELLALKGHTGRITHVEFSPDGQRLITREDSAIKIWDAPPLEPFLDTPQQK